MNALGRLGYRSAIPLTYSVTERTSLWFGSEAKMFSSEMDTAGINTFTPTSRKIHTAKRMMKTTDNVTKFRVELSCV